MDKYMNILRVKKAWIAAVVLWFFSAGASAQCVVASTNFDTSSDLCCPILNSDSEEDGWYNEDLDWDGLCKNSMFTGPEYATQNGIGGVFSSDASGDMTDVDDVFHLNNLNTNGSPEQYGYSTVTAQPKLVHSFCKANETPNNMYVNIGSGPLCPIVSYTVYGLAPGSTAELSFTLYNLLDATYFDHIVNEVCVGTKATKSLGDFITKYNYSNQGVINGNKLEFGVVSSDDNVTFNTSYNNALQLTNSKNATTATADYGASTTVTHTATVPETGTVTFYFYRTSDCFQIPIGIDDIVVTGEVKPVIYSTGNPCPEQPLRVSTKQTYPTGTKFLWKESVTGQTSTDASFNFVPETAETDYHITLQVTLPGCTATTSEVLDVHSGTCCTSADGAPMAMTNLFYDDFGDFVSDDTYEWTDIYGTTHTVKIPAGQVHTSQSHGGDIKIPYVEAYNIESSGATLKVPVAGSVAGKTELYNHGIYVVSKYGGYPGGVQYDNSGTTTGGMLQFDLLDDGSQDEFFEIDVEHICTGKEITFGADFASISNHPGCIEVTLEYNGNVLEYDQKSFMGGSDGWKNVSKQFTIESSDVGGASEVTVTMKVKHNQSCVPPGDSETRDYAIDNIIFQVCTPPDVNVESSVSTGKDILDLCTEDVLTLTSVTSDAVKRFYLYSGGVIDPTKKVGYVYQYTFQDPSTESTINPITWTTLHTQEVVETETFDVDVATYWDDIFSQLEDDPNHEKRIYFRVVVGEYSDLLADQSWKTTSAFSSCRKISISTIPVVAGLNCASCTKPDDVVFSAAGGKFTKSAKKVELCQEDGSTTLGMSNSVHGIDKDGNDYYDYTVSWYKATAPSTVLNTKITTDVDATAPTLVVDWSDVEAAGTTGVRYVISIHDNFDTNPTTCDITDTILVVGNPMPTETLEDPDAFCEGSLSSEPVKTITGYEVMWYTGRDTATATTEPVVADVTAADSPSESYYVVKDKTTGCRSEVMMYTVTVNAIPDVTLDGTVADFCATVSDVTKQSPEATAIPTLPTSANGTVTWFTDKATTTPASTDLSTLTGSTTPVTYYYKVTSAEGCSDTSHITFTAMPTVMVEAEATPECDKTTVTATVDPTTATTITWSNGKTGLTFDIEDAASAGAFTVNAEATGYCKSADATVAADFYETPSALTTAMTQYLKTETPFKDILSQNASAVTGAETDATVMWLGQYATETAPAATTGASSTTPTPTAANPSGTDDETVYYYVYQQRTYGTTVCEGEMTSLTVKILGAPAPQPRDTFYCVSDAASSLEANVSFSDHSDPSKEYEYVWYDSETGGTGSTTAPTPSTATPGETTYWVSQRDKANVNNESSRMPLKVTVYGVKAPEIAQVGPYCAGDVAEALPTAYTEDNANYYYADKLVWSDGATTDATFTPNTAVSATTQYTYTATQYYTLPKSGVECASEATTITVDVNFTDVPGDMTISYIAAEADANNHFPSISTKGWSEEPGYTYYYQESGKTSTSQVAPSPTYDITTLDGKTATLTYTVYRVQAATGCKSEPSTITVQISDALPPIVSDVKYCEGESLQSLTATKNPQSGKSASDYTLLWYASQPLSTTDAADYEGDSYALSGVASVTGGATTTTSYWVAQRDETTGAASNAMEIKVIVYPSPVLSIANPAAVCQNDQPMVDIAPTATVTNSVTGMSYTAAYYGDAAGATAISSTVSESGTYYIQYAYDAKVNTGEQCKSTIDPVDVTINTLSVLSQNVPTCPDMSATFTVEVTTNATTIQGSWSGNGDNGSFTTATSTFETKAFVGAPYDSKFPYTLTVTAGACTYSGDYQVEVGKGPVVGTLTLSDPTNTQEPTRVFTNDVTSAPYYFCGGDVTVTPNYTGDGDYEMTTPSGTKQTSAPFTASEAGVYTIAFTNGCPTSASFIMKDASISVTNTTANLTMCEGELFTSSLTVTNKDPEYTIEWTKDGAAISGATSAVYTIGSTTPAQSGTYAATVNSHGCEATTEVGDLLVKPYIQVTADMAEHVVARGETEVLNVLVSIPADGNVANVDWYDNGTATGTNSKTYTESEVVKDHNYTIKLSDPNYCDAETTTKVLVDALLQLGTKLSDTLCYGLDYQMEIDTTGTGSFRQKNVTPSLVVTKKTADGTIDVTSDVRLDGTKLVLNVHAEKDVEYAVSFDYGSQHATDNQIAKVIPAISVTLPETPTICEGEEVSMTVTNIQPEGTTVEWRTDPTIVSTSGATATLAPTYNASTGVNHQSSYQYVVEAKNSICNNSQSYKVSVNVDEPLTGTLTAVTPICEGDGSSVDASAYQATAYNWTVLGSGTISNSATTSVTPKETTTYAVTMTRGLCSAEDQIEVKVTSQPVIVRMDSVGVRSREVVTEPGKGTGMFYYWLDGNDGVMFTETLLNDLNFGTHTVYVKDENGCSNSYKFSLEAPVPVIPAYFTPNGDGQNDTWIVETLAEVYPNAVIHIYDRFGKIVAEFLGAEADGWDGTYKGNALPSTDYWYMIDIEEIDRQYTGHFTLLRR